MSGTQCTPFSLTTAVSILAGVYAGTSGTVDSSDPSMVQFVAPRYITSDGTYVYASDYSSTAAQALIRRTTISTGATTTLAGGDAGGGVTCPGSNATTCKDGVGTAARFNTPGGLVKIGNYLYIVDIANDRIRRLNLSNNTVDTVAGNGTSAVTDNAAGLSASFANAVDITTDGTNLYVADTYQIRKITIGSNFAVARFAGNTSTGTADGAGLTTALFNNPRHLTSDGINLYITDNTNNNIRKVVLATAVVSTIAGGNTGGGTTCTGSNATSCKNGVGTAAQFSAPRGITTDKTYLYVAENGTYRIRKINISDGTVTTLAGSGVNAWNGNGSGTSVDLGGASGITTDGTSLYVGSVVPGSWIFKIN